MARVTANSQCQCVFGVAITQWSVAFGTTAALNVALLEYNLFLNDGESLWRLLLLIANEYSWWLMFLDNIERLCFIFENPIVIESITASD